MLKMRSNDQSPMLFFWMWLIYVLFVIYGSLVPFEPHFFPLDRAWSRFTDIRLLNVGAVGRADWIANGVLYLPLGFLTTNLISCRGNGHPSIITYLSALIFGVCLAVIIEFFQLFFPPRTVSLNDLIAETIGTLVGATLALSGLSRFRALMGALYDTPRWFSRKLLSGYLVVYIALSLFPYDFVLSTDELSTRLASDSWGWFLAPVNMDAPLRLIAKLSGEILAVMPVGVLLSLIWQTKGRRGIGRALTVGILMGFAIEFLQLLLVSGVAQGLSIVTRALGVAFGLLAKQSLDINHVVLLRKLPRRYTVLAVVCYLLALAGVNHWFSGEWLDWRHAQEVYQNVSFIPFFYHYYTSETVALVSVISILAMYAPVGLLSLFNAFSLSRATLIASTLASLVESSKLFISGLHPDPTNILVAVLAAWVVSLWMRKLLEQGVESSSIVESDVNALKLDRCFLGVSSNQLDVKYPVADIEAVKSSHSESVKMKSAHPDSWMRLVILLSMTLVIAWYGFHFPFKNQLLAVGMLAYAGLIWRQPGWVVFFIPFGAVSLDLASWSGWYLLDEFDLLMLVSLLVVKARLIGSMGKSGEQPMARFLWGLLAFSFLIGVARSGIPLKIPDISILVPYFSSYNALRILKGVVWAFLFFRILSQLSVLGVDVTRWLGRGLIAGLIVVVAVVAWERAVYPGLFDFADVYRVTGPFSQMHVGGSDIESYLTIAVPFLIVAVFASSRWSVRLTGSLLFSLCIYAVLVTYSRMAYLACGVAILMTSLAYFASRDFVDAHRWIGGALQAFFMLMLAAFIAVSILSGSFAQDRFAQVGKDFEVRIDHWQNVMRIRDTDWMTRLLGMGVGRFPEAYFWRGPEPKTARFDLGVEDENRFLRLGPGLNLYLDQFVLLNPGERYWIELRLRGLEPDSSVSVSLCEKWLLTSAGCEHIAFKATGLEEWQVHRVPIAVSDLDSGNPLLGRTVKLSIQHSGGLGVIDLDDVRLVDLDGRDLLANGDFSRGFDRWFFSVDNDLPWHVWSLPVTILFDQGWLGLLIFTLVFLVSIRRLGRAISKGRREYAAVMGALLGVLILGTVNSIIDSPRILFLLITLVMIGFVSAHDDSAVHAGGIRGST